MPRTANVARIKWDTNPDDAQLIDEICDRAEINYGSFGQHFDRMSVEMDITACHLNGCKLDLKRWLDADDFNFNHDLLGITRHIDRDTGKLRNCFLPRFAAKGE